MRISRTKYFLKQYRKLHPATRKKVDRLLRYMAIDLGHPGLNTKKMRGTDIWEARVDKHNRMTFHLVNDIIVLRKVGPHDVLKKP